MEIKPKRWQGPNMGKPVQGNAKDTFAGIVKKEPKGKDQGPQTEEHPLKNSDAPEASKVATGSLKLKITLINSHN